MNELKFTDCTVSELSDLGFISSMRDNKSQCSASAVLTAGE